MNRIFATVTKKEDTTIEIGFITITDEDMNNSDNLGVDVETIVRVKHLGYNSVREYYDDIFDPEEWNDLSITAIEENVEDDYSDPGWVYRDFKEYISF